MNTRLLSLTSLTCIALASSVATAQNVSPGLIDRSPARVAVPKEFNLQAEGVQPVLPARDRVENPNQVVANIHSVNLTGVSVVKEEYLQVVALPYLNRPLTNQDLANLKFDIERELFERGYSLVKAITPVQDLSDGVLDVQLVEATVGSVNVTSNTSLSPGLADAINQRIQPGDVFNEEVAESMVSDIDTLKDVQASLTLQPGREFATTDIAVAISEASDDVNYAQIDNYGSKFTGEYVGSVHLEQSNTLGLGETVYVDGRISNDNLWFAGGGVRTPIGVRNVMLEASGSYSENQIGDILEPQDIEGNTTRFDVGLSSNVINRKTERLNVKVGFEYRDHESTQQGTIATEDNIRQVYGQASYLTRGNASVWYGAVKVSQGVDAFGASSDFDPMLTRARGENDAVIVRPVLVANVRPIDDGTVKFAFSSQLASENLLSSDLFALGGYGSVRGFDPAQEVGEAGYQFSLEYAHELGLHPDWFVTVGPFLDGGMVFNNVPQSSVDRHLYSVGLGMEGLTSLVPSGDTTLRFDYAYPVGHYEPASDVADDGTFYFSMRQDF